MVGRGSLRTTSEARSRPPKYASRPLPLTRAIELLETETVLPNTQMPPPELGKALSGGAWRTSSMRIRSKAALAVVTKTATPSMSLSSAWSTVKLTSSASKAIASWLAGGRTRRPLTASWAIWARPPRRWIACPWVSCTTTSWSVLRERSRRRPPPSMPLRATRSRVMVDEDTPIAGPTPPSSTTESSAKLPGGTTSNGEADAPTGSFDPSSVSWLKRIGPARITTRGASSKRVRAAQAPVMLRPRSRSPAKA